MRRLVILILFVLLLLTLTACSREPDPMERALEIRERFQTTTQRFAAHITADYGDRVHPFTLRFDTEALTLEVLAPEAIAGIVVEVSGNGTTLHFDGAVLDTGPLTEDGLSPIAALPFMVHQWMEGHIIRAHYETFHDIRSLVMTTTISDTVQHMTWFNAETGAPLQAELQENGRIVITAHFEGGPLF
ncbi:MAG: hypothetical protein FWE28_02520 [Oscillospiraceae bacterium]|nr:hypothetical protein [Oscillospiraceae bacterium]